MDAPYIPERQSETWTNNKIRDFFTGLGFKLLILPVAQHTENLIPADFIFFDKERTKLFGLQYKALYHNNADYWPIDKRQAQDLRRYPWIYYCLSELKQAIDHDGAIHFVRIANGSTVEPRAPKLLNDPKFRAYLRWGTFYKLLEGCHKGVLVESEEHLRRLLMAGRDDPKLEFLAQQAVDIFLVDFSTRHAANLSPFTGQ
jgi:hypothetical protein